MKNPVTRKLLGMLLVALQFALVALLLWPPVVLSATAFVLLAAGAALGLWTLLHNRIGNFNIRPVPKENGKLVTSGPYRFIRHPMYTAVLLMMAAFVVAGDTVRLACWLLLLAVLWIKSSLEEIMLTQKFPEYDAYRQTVGRFLPKLSGHGKTP